MSLANGNELHHINLRFEMRPRQQYPPAVRADPLDEARDVALPIAAILHRPLLVAKHQRAEEHLAQDIAREDQADIALRAAELGEAAYRRPLGPPTRTSSAWSEHTMSATRCQEHSENTLARLSRALRVRARDMRDSSLENDPAAVDDATSTP